MSEVKSLIIKSIDSKSARKLVSLYHYSGKSTQNSQIHLGVFLNDKIEGVLQFGPSLNNRLMAKNLKIKMSEFLELNRMAFSDRLPKNSESRALGVSLRLLKKTYSHLKVIISFADACQCGDGTIYRASGFRLNKITKNSSLLEMPNGEIKATKALAHQIFKNGIDGASYWKKNGAKPIVGYQMKYLYFFDKKLEKQFDFIDFKKIPDHVKMYKGQKRASSVESGTSDFQSERGGESPTDALQIYEE
jgi:hypothetical protein